MDDTLPETTLVAHLDAMRRRPLVQATRDRLAQAMLDWVTAGWSGSAMPAAVTLRRIAGDALPGHGPAWVFGAGDGTGAGGSMAPLAAAFANAGIAHLREVDDAHRAAMLHPGVVAISPVLALAAAEGLSMRRAADAVLAGYEVALRVGESLGARHAASFHATATAGSVGAAAAAAVALGLRGNALHHALGIGATQAAGLWQLVDDEAHEAKSLHPAFAVRNGMMAAYSARAGLPGAAAFVTGRRGLYALLQGDGPLAALDGGLDAPERINTATIKAWPCCAQLFTPLDATRALIDAHAPAVDAIERVDVVIYPHALKIAGVGWPTKPAETCFSLRYVVAALLLKHRLGIEETEAPELDSAPLRALAAKITIATDDEFQRAFPERRPARVTLTMRDGQAFSAYRELRRGDPEDPFDWPALRARLTAFAPTLDAAAAERIADWCAAFADAAADDRACAPGAALFGG